MYKLAPRYCAVLALSWLLSACGSSSPVDTVPGSGAPRVACVDDDFCAGAAKAVVTPTQAHIDGVEESRLFIGSKTQQFNLGGFGINPLQNLPAPFASLGTMLTQPAQEPVHINERNGEVENTYLRITVLGLGETRMAFVTLDAVGAGNLIQKGVVAQVVAISCELDWCIPAENVLFGQTHTHAGADLQGLWGGVPQDWIQNVLYAGVAEATRSAVSARERVAARFAQGKTSEFNNYRRPRIDPADDADDAMSLLRFEGTRSKRPVAQILQYAAHPTSINEDPRVPHADYIFGAVGYLEREGGIGMYYNGPIADASGAGGACPFAEPTPYERVHCRGEQIARFGTSQTFRTLAPALSLRHADVLLPVTNPVFSVAGGLGTFNRYYDFTLRQIADLPLLSSILGTVTTELGQATPTAQTLVSRVSIGGEGGLEIATIPGEATNTFGQFIRRVAVNNNRTASVMLLGLTHNSFGYIIPEEEFSYIDPTGDVGFLIPFTGYEEFVSLGPLTAPLLRLEAYIPLFDAPALEYLPQYLRACVMPGAGQCVITDIALRLENVQDSYASQCRDAKAPEAFCSLLDPQTPLGDVCRTLALPSEVCNLLGDKEGKGG